MTLTVGDLRCEYRRPALGIDAPRPRLGWVLHSNRRATRQVAYRIQVASHRADLEQGRALLWDPGEVESDRSTQVEYTGPELVSFQRCWWRVRVRDGRGRQTGWSDPAWWEMGVLRPSDWEAGWISPDLDEKETDNPCPLLRSEFHLRAPVARARAYVTSLGLYEMEINGARVGNARLTPGFTSFHRRLQYQVHDVTELLREGPNAVGVTLADGWYRGHLWIREQPNVFGDKLALLAQLRVEYEDGGLEVIGTDDAWECSTGPILCSDLYYGEVVDARREIPGWSEPGCRRDRWTRVRSLDHGKEHLVCSPCEPVKVMGTLRPLRILTTPAGERVVDLGQNIAGTVRLEVEGEAGREVTLAYCEELTPEGNFAIDQLDILGHQKRSGRYYQIDRYVLKGGGPEVFEPRFTFHGFRYVRVEGAPPSPDSWNITGLVLHSDLAQTGEFCCSNPLVDRLQHNILWSQKGNFLEIPTDCPQREKMGWTGDIQVYAPTACFLMDSAGFLTKWLRDLKADQEEDGLVPHIVPWLPGYPVFRVLGRGGSAGWGDACTVVPWMLYLYYGDRRILEEMYPVMTRWLGFIQSRARRHIWSRGMHWGDWLEPGRKTTHYFLPWARKGYVATPFFARSAGLVARVAEVLGRREDASRYRALEEQVKAAYSRRYVRRDGRIRPPTQGAYVLALAFDMVPPAMRPRLAGHLAKAVRDNGVHLDTGFVSTAHLCHVLCRYGYEELAFGLLNQETAPSWLYEVRKGATTIWESWDAIRPDGSLTKGMSFNHYAFGAIGDWLYRYVAGISPDEARPGFDHLILAPHPGGGLHEARAVHRSPRGDVGVAWRLRDREMHLDVTVPPGSSATVRLPGARSGEVREGGGPLEGADGVRGIREEDGDQVLEVGSGTYRFRYPFFAGGPPGGSQRRR